MLELIFIIWFLLVIVPIMYSIAKGTHWVWFIWGFSSLLFIIPIFTGINIENGKGEHTGYITAVEYTGIFFKTGRAYVKTDPQSTQEDTYCVIDENVFKKLEELSKTKTSITLQYKSFIKTSIKDCGNENEVIYNII